MFTNTMILVANWSPYIAWIVIMILSAILARAIAKGDAINANTGYAGQSITDVLTTKKPVRDTTERWVINRNGTRWFGFPSQTAAVEYLKNEVKCYNTVQDFQFDSDRGSYKTFQDIRVNGVCDYEVITWTLWESGISEKSNVDCYIIEESLQKQE